MKNTSDYQNLSLYSIFPRVFSETGDFNGIIPELDRIKNMGFNGIWLLPIHPIGEINRKGQLGSPYAIRDYFGINPEYGSVEDFKNLVTEIHNKGLMVLTDVVFHHTAWDSVLLAEHEDWFYHKADGSIGNKVGDWSDIADLDFNKPALWDYLIKVLFNLVDWGVDGFRCDVAPLIPIEFWIKARKTLEEKGHHLIWLSESIEPNFIRSLRRMGHRAHSDGEMFAAFDILYDYDIYPEMKDYFNGRLSLSEFLKAYSRQDWTLPDDYIKLRFLENHDQARAKDLIKDRQRLLNATAFAMFLKGAWLFYNGQETLTEDKPDLFEGDRIAWSSDAEMVYLQTELNKLKKMDFFQKGDFSLEAYNENIAHLTYEVETGIYHGWFNLGPVEETFDLELAPDTTILFSLAEIKPHKNLPLPLIYFTKTLTDIE